MTDISWSGIGVPSIGAQVVLGRGDQTFIVTVIAHAKGAPNENGEPPVGLVVFQGEFGPGFALLSELSRDPAQVAAFEKDAAIQKMLALDVYDPQKQLGMMSRKDFCAALYDAGCRFPSA